MSTKVGDRIRKYRQLSGMNQEYVAEEIGMSGGNLGKIERGEIDINTDYLYKLAKLFNVSVSDFFEDKPFKVAEGTISYGYASKSDLEELSSLVRKLIVEVAELKKETASKGKGRTGQKHAKKK